MIEQYKKFINSWLMWIVGLLVIGALITLGLIGKTIVERVVFENSYQKVAADKKATNVYSAQLAEIQYRLQGELDDDVRKDLEAQQSMLRVQQRAQ